MKAASGFMSAASAVALSAALAVPGAVTLQFAAVSAAQAAVVSSIQVRGNQRVDAETVRNYLTIKAGKTFSSGDIDESVKRLFDTGLFSDVNINQVGGTLVVQVSEYQVVNQVLFQGNKKLKDSALAMAVQSKARGTYSPDTVASDVEAIKAAYKRVGRDDAGVTSQLIDLGENRVNVVFNINEGGRTKIRAVNFVGNNAFSDRRLGDLISTKRSSFLSFALRDDIYDEDRLKADEEALRRFYYNRGYADFEVVSAFGELDDATNEYTVTITVNEGERYTFGEVSIDSTLAEVSGESLMPLVKTRSGQVYSAKDTEDTIIALTEQLAGMGYAFAQVTPRGDRNFETRTINVVYTVDQGAKTYIERIEIRGNTRTRDFVIRREFDVSEGDAFNQVLIQRAKRRLEKLDFFESVNISTAPGSEPDQVVLVVDVVDKSTGEFSIGAGYSTGGSDSGPSVEGSITERNFLGRGQYIRLAAGVGSNSRDYTFSFTEPYFLGRRIAAGFDVFRNTREYDNYEVESTGATIRFGLPITEALSTQVAYNISRENYDFTSDCDGSDDPNSPDLDCHVSQAIIQGVDTSPWIKSSVSGTIVFNTIDDMKNPHAGLFTNFTTEVAGLGGDAQYLKLTARGSYYKTLSDELDVVGLLSAGAGHILPFGNDLRVFDYFQSSERMIRGFEYGGIGPVDTTTDERLGGATYFNASAEAQFPLPVIPESFGMRAAVFADTATLFGNDLSQADASTGMKWRASVGMGLIWASPFGPLRLDYAIPVLKEDTDQVQEFNFGVSTRF